MYNRPLTTQNIINQVSKLKINDFQSVFLRNNLTKKLYRLEYVIVNLDMLTSTGSHWIAYHKNQETVIYFDSFEDLTPPIGAQKYFKGYQ